VVVRPISKKGQSVDCVQISANAFSTLIQISGKRGHKEVEVFSASMADIEKALSKRDKKSIDPYIRLPKHYHEFLDMFSPKEAKKLPPLHGIGVDYRIKLEKVDSKTLEVL
jgi:hypothetical protein